MDNLINHVNTLEHPNITDGKFRPRELVKFYMSIASKVTRVQVYVY